MTKHSILFIVLAALAGGTAWAQTAEDGKQTFNHNVLIEQFTTGKCQYCPGGAERIASAVGNSTNVVWIKHHAGFSEDDLTNDIHRTMLCFYNGSTYAPAVMFDRRHLSDDPGPVMSVGYVSDLRNFISQAKNEPCYTKILPLATAYDPATRRLRVSVSGRFGDAGIYNPDVRMILFLVEDSIYMAQSVAGQGMVSDFLHMGTVRDTLTPMWGADLTMEEGTLNYSLPEVIYRVPEGFDPAHCKVVAIMYEHNAADINGCAVLNSLATGYLSDMPLAIGHPAPQPAALRLFPNPAQSRLTVECAAGIAEVTLLDALGREALRQQGCRQECQAVDCSALTTGIYVVRVLGTDGRTHYGKFFKN